MIGGITRPLAVAVVLVLSACGGGGGKTAGTPLPPPPQTEDPVVTPPEPSEPDSRSPAYHLGTARFTTHQPQALEQIGAHHAYAKGLTGRGVRIGIDDTAVDFTQSAEFGGRIKLTHEEGAKLYYDRFAADFDSSLIDEIRACNSGSATCTAQGIDSQGGRQEELVNGAVRRSVRETGMPLRDDSTYVVDKHHVDILADENATFGAHWWALQYSVKEVPTPYGRHGSHGTAVASVAAGARFGVAPEASIIPIAQNLTDDDQADDHAIEVAIRNAIESLPQAQRNEFDNLLAAEYRSLYGKFDIINRSYGYRNTSIVRLQERQAVQWARQYIPNGLDAWAQVNTSPAARAIVVYAAGNDSDPNPGLGAALPALFAPFRGHTLAVVATDPATGIIAGYSNRCGRLPSNWNTARHGRHYCLAAPGTLRALQPNQSTPGRGDISVSGGTSFAAPVVSGGLALLMEHFRGTRGNTEIVRRMLDTANRGGRYGDLETYGAGLLDLEAALSPVGLLSVGMSGSSVSDSTLYAPAAFGSLSQRVGNVEVAAFDSQDFPFWMPVSSRIATRRHGVSPIPVLEAGSEIPMGLEALGQRWAVLGTLERSWTQEQRWVAGFGPSSASLARKTPGPGWSYGMNFDTDGYMGSQTSGAFGTDLHSGFSWISRTAEQALWPNWTLTTRGTVALGAPRYERNAIFSASPSLLSALSVRLGTKCTGFTVEQPLRAETGTGTFRVENGRIENGRRLYDVHRVSLRPKTREVRMTLRHEIEGGGGRIAFQAGVSMNAGHITGEHEAHAGLALRQVW